MEPEYCSNELPKAEKMEFWAENVRVVEQMTRKYSTDTGSAMVSICNAWSEV
jgi:hypothetical protein